MHVRTVLGGVPLGVLADSVFAWSSDRLLRLWLESVALDNRRRLVLLPAPVPPGADRRLRRVALCGGRGLPGRPASSSSFLEGLVDAHPAARQRATRSLGAGVVTLLEQASPCSLPAMSRSARLGLVAAGRGDGRDSSCRPRRIDLAELLAFCWSGSPSTGVLPGRGRLRLESWRRVSRIELPVGEDVERILDHQHQAILAIVA